MHLTHVALFFVLAAFAAASEGDNFVQVDADLKRIHRNLLQTDDEASLDTSDEEKDEEVKEAEEPPKPKETTGKKKFESIRKKVWLSKCRT